MPTTATSTKDPARTPGPATRQAAEAATRAESEHRREDALVDAESEQSFPASDPPSWTLGSH